jgi:hypothetical protein
MNTPLGALPHLMSIALGALQNQVQERLNPQKQGHLVSVMVALERKFDSIDGKSKPCNLKMGVHSRHNVGLDKERFGRHGSEFKKAI